MAAAAEAQVSAEACVSMAGFAHTQARHLPLVLLGTQPLLAGFRVQEPPSPHICFWHKLALALRGALISPPVVPGGGVGSPGCSG